MEFHSYAAHSKGKEHVCNECNKSFTQKRGLNAHYSIHTGEKPHVCHVCKKGFRLKSILRTHELIHTGMKPHVCDVCNNCFTFKKNLNRHAFIHTGQKPHKCEVCQKSFNDKNSLNRHSLIHTGQRLHVCDVCQQGFAQKHNLKRHYLTHTKEKNHICKICKRGFADKYYLNKHLLLCVKRENKKRLKLQGKKDEGNHVILRIHEDGSVLEEHTAEETVKQQYVEIDQDRNPIILATAHEHVDETSTDCSESQDSVLLYRFQQVPLEVAADVTIDQEFENVVNQDLNFTHEIIQPSNTLDHQDIVQHVQNPSSQTSSSLLSPIGRQTFGAVDQQASSEVIHQTCDINSQQAYSPISNQTFTQYQDQTYDYMQQQSLNHFPNQTMVTNIADPNVPPEGYPQMFTCALCSNELVKCTCFKWSV